MKTKRLLAMLLAIVMVFALVACSESKLEEPTPTEPAPTQPANNDTPTEPAPTQPANNDTPTEPAPAPTAAKVGVSMPTNDLQRWNQDGDNLKKQLEAKGYEVVLQFGANEVATQVTQIENMIADGCKVLVIAAIEGDSLGTVLAQAKENDVTVIAYDRLIMSTGDVDYYVTFDNFKVGAMQGAYIEEALGLKSGAGPFNMEIVGGDPGDNNAQVFFDGEMSVLGDYIKNGQLVVVSGQTEFAQIATPNWDTAKAQERFENILSTYYADKELHAVCDANDSTAQGVANALAANYTGENYPVITGQDCDKVSVINMIAGKQAMSVFKDTRDLASQTVTMVDAIMSGAAPETNDNSSYNNGVKVVPSYLCAPVVGTVDNYKTLLLDSGYYTEADLQG